MRVLAVNAIVVAGAVWAIASALAVGLVAATSLLGGRGRARGAVSFGLFGLLWSVQLTLINVTRLPIGEDLARWLVLLSTTCLLPLPYFLVEFAASQWKQPAGAWGILRGASVALPVVSAILLIVDPSLLFVGVKEVQGTYFPLYGPLHVPLVTLPFFASFSVALLSLHRAKRLSPTPRVARRATFFLGGLGAYVAFAASNNLVFYLDPDNPFRGDANTLAFAFVFLGLAATCLYLIIGSLRDARRVPTASERATNLGLFLVLAVPFVWGAIEGYLAQRIFPRLDTVGIWRILGVAIIAYGFARWRIYDLPARAKRVAANTSGTAAAAVGGVAVYGLGTAAMESTILPAIAGVIVISAAVVPSIRFVRRIFGIQADGAGIGDDDSVYGQRVDAYRAALEASLARGSLDEDVEFLAALRERFSISDAEDRLLRHYAKASVLVARDRKAYDAYERLRLLGEGGGGRTWLARDRQRDRLVVLKEPLQHWQQDPTTREAVLREARMAARVRHANVVAVEEVVEGKGSPVIVMEYMDGGSLSDHLRARGTLPWREAVPLVVDVLRGVEAVHASGLVHRDIKPSNILLTGDGTPKVADFGIAIPQSTNKTILDVGSTARAGTMFYMAPEVRAGISLGDRRADVYACGAVLHECLYGAPPGAHAPVILRSDVPAAISAILARALAERPEERMGSARLFAEELTRVLKG